jgi:hypothetical protein
MRTIAEIGAGWVLAICVLFPFCVAFLTGAEVRAHKRRQRQIRKARR